MVVRISGTTGITFGVETFATESYVDGEIGAIPVKEKKIAAFTSSGTWTVPAGVTYAIAHMIGGGGGSDRGSTVTAGVGGASSVAFAGGTVSAPGAGTHHAGTYGADSIVATPGPANSGRTATISAQRNASNENVVGVGLDANWIVAGDDVTPGASITVTVGAGGTAGTDGAAGGSGYVYIEYYEDAA